LNLEATTIVLQQQIAGMQITMCDAALMQVCQKLGEIPRQLPTNW